MPATITYVGLHKVRVSKEGVAAFNALWPDSPLSDSRAYWFEFDSDGDLIDSDVPEHSEGKAADAMGEACKAWLFDEVWPDWAPEDAPTDSPADETSAEQGARYALEALAYLDSDLTPEQRAAVASLRDWAASIIRD